eukprot:scaffold4335_cov220-Pinguiococcus_pyrenoidosus.AAC.5
MQKSRKYCCGSYNHGSGLAIGCGLPGYINAVSLSFHPAKLASFCPNLLLIYLVHGQAEGAFSAVQLQSSVY